MMSLLLGDRVVDSEEEGPGVGSLSELVLLYIVQTQERDPIGGGSISEDSPLDFLMGHFLFLLPPKNSFLLELLLVQVLKLRRFLDQFSDRDLQETKLVSVPLLPVLHFVSHWSSGCSLSSGLSVLLARLVDGPSLLEHDTS